MAWLAGLLEGEGSFGLIMHRRGKAKKKFYYPIIELSMCDEDVVARAAAMMGCGYGKKFPPSRQRAGWQPQYRLRVEGGKARSLMIALRPNMGARRQAQIDAALS